MAVCDCYLAPKHQLDGELKTMIPIRDLFEGHLTVSDLQRSMDFFGNTLGLELAQIIPETIMPLPRNDRCSGICPSNGKLLSAACCAYTS